MGQKKLKRLVINKDAENLQYKYQKNDGPKIGQAATMQDQGKSLFNQF